MVSLLYDVLNVISNDLVMQKTLDKEYNWMVSLLYDVLNELLDTQVVQKTLDREYN